MRLLIVRAAFVLTAISLITVCAGLKRLEAGIAPSHPSAKASVGVISASFPRASSDTGAESGDGPPEGPLDIADIGAGKAQADGEAEPEEPPADADTDIGLDTLPRSSFGEVWGYLLSGREADLDPAGPVSDAVHFAAEVDRYGRLADIPRRSAITGFGGRVHLAVVCGSGGLSHFVIQTGSAARKRLVADIIAAAGPYDGLNIDMEYIPALDGEHFLSFLAELRAGLEGKPLSVCVPARTRDGTAGPYSYAPIAALAERVFVMAYDEHWSGSSPGPVASMEWCEEVAAYSLRTVGAGKLVMGLPFYGRGWADKSTAQALVRGTAERLREEHDASDLPRASGVPGFTYDVTVRVTVYYED
jgi:hypothetical protein